MCSLSASELCVLIVDDEADARDLTARLVAKAQPSAVVVTAAGPEGAASYLLRALSPVHAVPMPHLILLDLHMPEADGFEVLCRLRKDPAFGTVKVVMLTSSDSPQNIKRAAELGADGYLLKFPNPAVLAGLLHQVSSSAVAPGSNPCAA